MWSYSRGDGSGMLKLRRLLPGLALAASLAFPTMAFAQADVVEYYHLDALGNVMAVSNAAGVENESHDYLPFGEEWCGTSVCGTVNAGQPKRFTGKERDAETGLDYFGARYYRANVGRFTTIDPVYTWQENLEDPQRWNRYAYVRNNPLKYVDPDGRVIHIAGGAGVGFVIGFGYSLFVDQRGFQAAFAKSASGALVGSVAAATGGGSLLLQGGSVALASAAGGAVERGFDGDAATEALSRRDVGIDLGAGFAGGAAGGIVGRRVAAAVAASTEQAISVRAADRALRIAVSRQAPAGSSRSVAAANAQVAAANAAPTAAGISAAGVPRGGVRAGVAAGAREILADKEKK
jgi:RHS repeat-associated protein